MGDEHDRDLMVYRLGLRTPCCDRIVRHIDPRRIVCRGCGTVYDDITAGVSAAFPGAVDHTAMTPQRFLRGE